MKNILILKSFLMLFVFFNATQMHSQIAAGHESNGVFKLSSGNEMRFKLMSLKSERITGILVSEKGVRMASFTGKINHKERSIKGDLTYCNGSKSQLIWYFTRGQVNTAEVYLISGKKEIKATATRIKKGVPDLSLSCPVNSLSNSAKASWTGTWESTYGELRLLQLMSPNSYNKVIGDYSNLGHIDANFENGKWNGLFNNGNREGQVSFVLSADGNSFTGTWKFNGETQWNQWSGTKKSSVEPEITHHIARVIIDRILFERNN